MGTTLLGVSKSTLNGVLALLITILTAVLAFQVPAALMTPQLSHIWLWVTTVCTLVCGVLRAVVGFLENDAPTPPPAPQSLGASVGSMKKLSAVLLCAMLIPLGLGLSGCKPATTQPGAVAPTFYSQAATAMDGFSSTLESAQSLFQTACTEKLVDAASCTAGEKVFLQVAQSADGIVSALQAGVAQSTVERQITALVAQLGTMPQAFAIKNPQSQAAFSSLVNSLVSILQATQASLPAPGAAN